MVQAAAKPLPGTLNELAFIYWPCGTLCSTAHACVSSNWHRMARPAPILQLLARGLEQNDGFRGGQAGTSDDAWRFAYTSPVASVSGQAGRCPGRYQMWDLLMHACKCSQCMYTVCGWEVPIRWVLPGHAGAACGALRAAHGVETRRARGHGVPADPCLPDRSIMKGTWRVSHRSQLYYGWAKYRFASLAARPWRIGRRQLWKRRASRTSWPGSRTWTTSRE
ncbi:hypothetical protein CVIRNUC_007549 [Coccomyxa viridis]|uniref:Uncharacterized protein n=1 Tax=Coccomyxa viridis TaxID=1274662 RepID=A0AAV1ICY7_9CHLO|nr:hypothetical protein CVIRNUC_007549 [Coccomyxa viridis]